MYFVLVFIQEFYKFLKFNERKIDVCDEFIRNDVLFKIRHFCF